MSEPWSINNPENTPVPVEDVATELRLLRELEAAARGWVAAQLLQQSGKPLGDAWDSFIGAIDNLADFRSEQEETPDAP